MIVRLHQNSRITNTSVIIVVTFLLLYAVQRSGITNRKGIKNGADEEYNRNSTIHSSMQNTLCLTPDELRTSIPHFDNDSRLQFQCNGTFINRSKNASYLLIILAGYKTFLNGYVYPRIASFLPTWIDVCITSAGVYSNELMQLACHYGWSYLSTQENNLCLIQNVAIKLHIHAKFIFKLDEDMFITENYFKMMIAAFNHATTGPYIPGMIAPLITINSYGSRRILDKFNCLETYNKLFPPSHHEYHLQSPLFRNFNVTLFFWGEGGYLPSLDKMNKIVAKQQRAERPSGIRFNIGALLFTRQIWENMGYLPVDRRKIGLGHDEAHINRFCYMASRPIMVSENIIVGHFCHSPQNEKMKQYLESHQEVFKLKK